MTQLFFVTAENPNDVCGGGGCACSELQNNDCQPPFIVFPGTQTDNYLSPHVVVCTRCAEEGVEQARIEVLGSTLTDSEVPPEDEDDVPATEPDIDVVRSI